MRRAGLSPDQWRRLARDDRVELLALEYEREQIKSRLLAQWPNQDWGRNLAALFLTLD